MSKKNILEHFETIDTEEKAYWLGFLYADGNVHLNEDKVELGLAEKDLHHIEKFKDFIGLPNKISYRPKTNSYRFSFRSKMLKADLIDKGCTPKKSLTLKFPTNQQVPKKLIRHFIRGYFDGDGWFTSTDKSLQLGFIGTLDFIQGVLKQLPHEMTLNKIHYVHPNQNKIPRRYLMSKKIYIAAFLIYMYKDAHIFLDRKYSHAISWLVSNGYQDFL